MAAPLAHSEIPTDTADRRLGARRQAPLTYVELGEDNGGIVLNISEGGFAVQAVGSLIDGQLPQIRFQFSESGYWIETSGRIAWTSESKKVAGVEFVSLPDKEREQLREWIFSDPGLSGNQERTDPIASFVNQPDASESMPGIRVPEPERKQVQDSISSAHLATSASESTGSKQLRDDRAKSAVAREVNATHVNNNADRRPALQPEEETAPKKQKAGQRSEEGASWSRNVFWLVASLALVVLLIVSFFELRSRHLLQNVFVRSGAPVESHMGLKLERLGSDWRFSWNPDAPVISKATKGQLSITDGTFRKVLDLDSSDLQGGTIIYTPLTNDVVLRLEVNQADPPRAVSESIRIAAAAPSSLPPQEPSVAVDNSRANAGPATSAIVPAVPRTDVPAPRSAVSTPMNRLSPVEAPKPLRTNPSTVSADVKQAGDKATPPAKTERIDLPATTPALPVQVSKLDAVSPEQVSPATPARELVQPVSHLEPAQLIARREPIYPKLALQTSVSGAVEVHFHIRADGTVHDVSVVRGNPVLARAALDAVQTWRYLPARLGQIPIETENNAVLNFTK